jgi:pseudouridine 5'-phosphatase
MTGIPPVSWVHESRLTLYTSFKPIRACIFDVDGLLIDSEDAYSAVTNTILHENGRPDLPWKIKAQLQGRPGPEAGRIFHEWAKLPISHDNFVARNTKLQAEAFKHCKPLPGVQMLLNNLECARPKPHMALATSSMRTNFDIKIDSMKNMFSIFAEDQIVTGDDPRVPKGRGKPLPDIYLVALQTINEHIRRTSPEEAEVRPDECIVFEDSVPGVEAGRRAGMRVVWCPHPGLLNEFVGLEKEVLAGGTGEHNEEEIERHGVSSIEGSPGHVGEIDDGWAEMLQTLEDFRYEKYGINV